MANNEIMQNQNVRTAVEILVLVTLMVVLTSAAPSMAADGSTPIYFGDTNCASIDFPGECDSYTFWAEANDVVLIRCSSTSGYFDPYIRLYDSGGNLIDSKYCTSSSSHTTCNIELCIQGFLNNDDYTIMVSDYGGTETGQYCLHLERLNPPVNLTPIEFGETSCGSIDIVVDCNTYTFLAEANDVVLISCTSTSGYFDPYIRLYGPKGNLIDSKYCTSSYSHTRCNIELCIQGFHNNDDYTIMVSDYGGDYDGLETGSFCLSLYWLGKAPLIDSWEIAPICGTSDMNCPIPSGYVAQICNITNLYTGYVEPRICGITRFYIWFDQAMDTSIVDPNLISIDGQINGPQPPPCSVMWDSNDCMVVELCSKLPDQDTYIITVSSDVKSADGAELGGNRSLVITALIGDVNGSKSVNASDLLAIRPHAGPVDDCNNARFDVNCSGSINAGDMLFIRPYAGNVAP